MKRHAGMSLVELLVALAVAALLLAGLIKILTYTRQTFRLQSAQAHLMEDGRYAMEVLARELYQAGYDDNPGQGPVNGPAITVSGFTDLGANEYIHGFTTATPQADGVVFRYQLDRTDLKTNLQGTLCDPNNLGFLADPNPNTLNPNTLDKDNILLMKFYVANDSNGVPVLYCKAVSGGLDSTNQFVAGGVGNNYKKVNNSAYSGGVVTQPLVSNVEYLRILYGVSTDTSKCVDPVKPCVNRYVSQANVTDWTAVYALRLTLVLRSEEKNVVSDPITQLVLNGGLPHSVPNNGADRRLYRVFTTTIPLRNKALR